MNNNSYWIWLNNELYPDLQQTRQTTFAEKCNHRYGVVEFKKSFYFPKNLKSISFDVSGDTKFRLWANDSFVGTGPVCAGGDYAFTQSLSVCYKNNYSITVSGTSVTFFAQVQLSPQVMTDTSKGHGGFYLLGTAVAEDNTTFPIFSDDTWQARQQPCHLSDSETDFTLEQEGWSQAVSTPDIWHALPSPIPMLFEEFIYPSDTTPIVIAPHSHAEYALDFDKIYSGYVTFEVECNGICEVEIRSFETDNTIYGKEIIKAQKPYSYRGWRMRSIGGYSILLDNLSDNPLTIKNIGLIFTCYPVTNEGTFVCSDEMLNKTYDVGKWTLKICRQTMHLDSPLHQETLGCTGDYFIESLMNYVTFGDGRLTRLDIVRTAQWLREHNGEMFHTSYSLIWLQMIYDYIVFCGDLNILDEIEDAIHILLERFHGYIGENGVLEHAPNYMFVDWIIVGDYNLHHPPKALGQTCLNAFYYKALTTATNLYILHGDTAQAQIYQQRSQLMKKAFNTVFFNAEKGLYISGLTDSSNINKWLPQNAEHLYYTKHANALAVLYDLCDPTIAKNLMEQVIINDALIDVQPYFMHFVLEALYHVDLFEKYGLKLLHRWDDMVQNCEKGMQEGWYAPGENYSFDHSHAWGATPTYQLPSKLLGLQIIEPGFTKIKLEPRLYGLTEAKIEIPTPFGMLCCQLKAGEKPILDKPIGITVIS